MKMNHLVIVFQIGYHMRIRHFDLSLLAINSSFFAFNYTLVSCHNLNIFCLGLVSFWKTGVVGFRVYSIFVICIFGWMVETYLLSRFHLVGRNCFGCRMDFDLFGGFVVRGVLGDWMGILFGLGNGWWLRFCFLNSAKSRGFEGFVCRWNWWGNDFVRFWFEWICLMIEGFALLKIILKICLLSP